MKGWIVVGVIKKWYATLAIRCLSYSLLLFFFLDKFLIGYLLKKGREATRKVAVQRELSNQLLDW